MKIGFYRWYSSGMRSSRFLNFLLVISSLSFSNSALAIMNGPIVETNSLLARTTVQIRSDKERKVSFCTGSIIAEDIVVTAAHCLRDQTAKISVVFNAPYGHWSKQFPIAGYVRHEVYLANEEADKAADHSKSDEADEDLVDIADIALLKLSAPLPEGYFPVDLPPSSLSIDPETLVTIAGYGIHKRFEDGTLGFPSEDLRSAEVPYLEEHGKLELKVGAKDGKAACMGDSGGPLLAKVDGKTYLWGELGRASYSCTGRALYTRVDRYLDWIKVKSEELRKGP